jgi:two-component system, chemotaxis family, CheB/CheR fusion protein
LAASQFPVVGIGASAGGIEALEGFFRGLSSDPGVAIVIVTHLGPDRKSLLHEVVDRYTDLEVRVVEEGVKVEVNTVYILAYDAILTLENLKFVLRKNTSRRERKPIDIFFSSLAIDLGECAVGVILSGGDSDGTLGVKAIKERGGLTFAQKGDGFGPHHADMPESAISTGLIDFAIPVDEMGEKIADFAVNMARIDAIVADNRKSDEHLSIDSTMPEIYSILRNQIGHDFSGYKTKTFMRRVLRRMQITQLETIDGYVERLRQEPREVSALFRDLLINVTNFFRDADAFDNLGKLVIPKLFEGRGAEDTVRIWVPGCSTGEEVFSIGILLREYMDQLTAVPRVQIFATDIDDRALGVARAARYPESLLDTVSAERRKRFFVPDGGSFVVSKDVRELCIFSPHSVIRDPPFSKIDLVSCRNLLIYFGAEIQNQVIPTFHYALRPEGYLFLGSAENVSQFDDLFQPIEKKHRIFRRRSDVASSVRLPIMLGSLRPGYLSELAPRRSPLGGLALRQTVDEHVIERFSPPHVVVNRDGDVVYYSSRTGKYLEAPAGAPTRQLLTMARKGLRLDLRTVFREAMETGRIAVRESVAVESGDDHVQMTNILVEPLADRAAGEPLYLVLFVDQGPALSREEAMSRASAIQDGASFHVERELRETRDRLQSMIEEYETALEELKSSNEELVSVNEEMQSTNEELEASKEELQSVNEELHTVNSELNSKVEALDRANSDLQNLFESTDVATVFLDKSLSIRSFTPTVSKIFNILPGDRGRPITDLSSKLSLPHLAEDVARVVAGKLVERRVKSDDGSAHYLVRLAPYRDTDQKPQGIVITFVDVTTMTLAEERQRVLIAELQHRTRNLLAVVQSIARQTIEKGGTVAAFSTRLAALGRVQNLVGSSSNDVVALADIVELELQAIGAPLDGKVTFSGPDVPLNFNLIQTFGLALHELSTNAAKYGALNGKDGTLDITWEVEDRENRKFLVVDWREHGVPIAETPERRGFGRELIERALTFTHGAKTALSFGSDGVICHIEMPLTDGPQT